MSPFPKGFEHHCLSNTDGEVDSDEVSEKLCRCCCEGCWQCQEEDMGWGGAKAALHWLSGVGCRMEPLAPGPASAALNPTEALAGERSDGMVMVKRELLT